MKRLVTAAAAGLLASTVSHADPIGYGYDSNTFMAPIFRSIDFATGVTAAINEPGALPLRFYYGMTWDAPNDRFIAFTSFQEVAAIDFGALTDMDPGTDPFSVLFTEPVVSSIHGIDTHPQTGEIYGQSESTGSLYRFDLAMGQLDLVQSFPGYTPSSLAIHPVTGEFFGMRYSNSSLYRLDLGTGAADVVFDTTYTGVIALDFDKDGTLWAVGDPGSRVLAIDVDMHTAVVAHTPVPRLDDITIPEDSGPPPPAPATDHYVLYRGKALEKTPGDFHLQLNDAVLDDSEPDDPENFTVLDANGVLNPARKNLEDEPGRPELHYLRFLARGSKQGVGAQLPNGNFPKAARHVARSWVLDSQFGGVIVESSKASALLVPTATVAGGEEEPPPPPLAGDATHYLCYRVKVAREQDTTQAPGGRFVKNLDHFFRVDESAFDDCVGDTFVGSANPMLQDACLMNLKKPKELCNPVGKSDVVAPRPTSAPSGMVSTPTTSESLLCYQAKPATKVRGSAAAALLGVDPETRISPSQSRHAGASIRTSISNQFEKPTVLSDTKTAMACVPTTVISAVALP